MTHSGLFVGSCLKFVGPNAKSTQDCRRRSLLLLLCMVPPALSLQNGLGQTPPMGYNTWNDLRCSNISAANIKRIADEMLALGLYRIGYNYLILDDCWATNRDPITNTIIADPHAFPEGMKDVADYVHGLGLKFGIYTDRGTWTCEARPGSKGFEAIDAATYASWGVDYLKEDSCNADANPDKAIEEYSTMRDALNATGRRIFFAVCGWNPWYSPIGASLGNSFRIAMDVNTRGTVWNTVSINSELARWAGPGSWNDPDSLVGTNINAAAALPRTLARTQFNLWAIMAAPLFVGTRLSELGSFDWQTYSNEDVIAVDQDPLGIQGSILWENCPPRNLLDLHQQARESRYEDIPDCQQVWSKKLAMGAVAVLLINWSPREIPITLDAAMMQTLGFKQGAVFKDLWTKEGSGGVLQRFEALVPGSCASRMYRLTRPNVVV